MRALAAVALAATAAATSHEHRHLPLPARAQLRGKAGGPRAGPPPLAAPPALAAPTTPNVTYTPLTLNQPLLQTLTVSPGAPYFSAFSYYSFAYDGSGSGGFTLTAGALAGTLDMFVGDATQPLPSPVDFSYGSFGTYTDHVSVPASACPAPPCQFYIALALSPQSASNASFYLLAQPAAAAAPATTGLLDGLPVFDAATPVSQATFNYTFTARFPSDAVTFAVQALSGTPFTAVTLGTGCTCRLGAAAAAGDFRLSGSGVITVSAASPAFRAAHCVVGVPCPVAISVGVAAGWVDATSFFLTAAAAPAVTQLVDSIPAPAAVLPGAYRYFAFNVPSPVAAVLARLGGVSGYPAAYMSFTNPAPNATAFTFCLTTGGDGQVVVEPQDVAFPVSFPATLYVGVTSAAPNASSTFTLTAAQVLDAANATVTQLADGQPQPGEAFAAWQFTYYTLTYNGTSAGGSDGAPLDGLQVSATALTGALDVYVAAGATSGAPPVLPALQCAAPAPGGGCATWVVDPSTYSWASGTTPGLVDVPPGALTPGQTITVGVLSTTTASASSSGMPPYNPSTFSVVTSTPATVTALQEGVPTLVGLAPRQTRLFSFTLSVPMVDVLISAAAFTGAASLNASESLDGSTPGWSAEPNGLPPAAALLSIPYAELSPGCRFSLATGVPCTLYVAVSGMDANTTLELTAGTPSSPATPSRLANGKAATSVLGTAGVQYFYAALAVPEGEGVYLSVQDWGASSTSMYVNVGYANRWYVPGSPAAAADYSSSGVGGYNELVLGPAGVGTAVHGAARGAPQRLRPVAASGGRVVLGQALGGSGSRVAAPPSNATSGSLSGSPVCVGYCELRITVTGVPGALFSVSLATGPTLTTLADGVPAFGWAPGDYSYTYFAYTTLSAVLPSALQLTAYAGAVDVFVAAQDPADPYALPSASSFTAAASSWAGTAYLDLPPAAPAPAAYYYIAVRSATPNNGSAYFSLVARAIEEMRPTPLQDGTPADGLLVSTLLTVFYSYALPGAAAGVPAPPVVVTFTALMGTPVLHVTSGAFPGGASYAALLSGATCQWSTANATGGQLVLDATSPCYRPDATAYTFFVTGDVGTSPSSLQVWPFQLSATAQPAGGPPAARRLTAGVPAAGLQVAAGANVNFLFEVTTPGQDVLLTVTPEGGGSVALLVAYANDTAGNPPPACAHPTNGSQILCTGWTWLGTTTLYIPGATPCNPLRGEGGAPSTAAQPACATFPPGRYWATVFSSSDTAFAIGLQAGAAQPMQLAAGVPALTQTANVTVCPTRDAASGTCPDPDVSPLSRVASQAFFRFVVPAAEVANGLVAASSLTVERMCPGGVAGLCGLPLHVMVRGCAAGSCTQDDQYPSSQSGGLEADFYVNTAVGSLALPVPPSCVVPANGTATDCVVFVGLAPVCGAPHTPGWNGLDCPSVVARVTWASPASPTRIPPDCTASGRSCVLPWVAVAAAPAVSRLQAYLGLGPIETALVTTTACFGDAQMSVCRPAAGGSACNPVTLPGPANNDFTGYSFGTGTVLWKDVWAGPLYLGLNAVGAAATAVVQLSVVSSASPQLVLFYNQLTAVRTGDGSVANVTYAAPRVVVPGTQPVLPSGLVYTAYAFPVSDIAPGTRLNVACGVQYAATTAAGLLTASVNDATSLIVTGLDPGTPYTLALVASCPAGSCLAGQASDQAVAYTATTVGPSSGGSGVVVVGGGAVGKAAPLTRAASKL